MENKTQTMNAFNEAANDNTPIMNVFNKAAERLGGMTRNGYIDAILEERPDLKDKMAYVPTQGFCSFTIIIEDEVFKFLTWMPEAMDSEIEVLKQLEGSSLPVPKVTYVSEERPFFAMTRMKGVTLPEDFMESFTEDQQNTLADDILDFVFKMAETCLKEGKIEDIYNIFGSELMIHNDFNLGNVLIDSVTKKLTAIIDFGLARYTDESNLKPGFWAGRSDFSDEEKAEECCNMFRNLLSKKYNLRRLEIKSRMEKKNTSTIKAQSSKGQSVVAAAA